MLTVQALHLFSNFLQPALTSLLVDTRAECSVKCVQQETCTSFFFTPSNTCHLSPIVFNDTDPSLIQHIAADYFLMDRGACSEVLGYKLAARVGVCYKLIQDSVPWMVGHNRCVADGGRLIQLDTQPKIIWSQRDIAVEIGTWIGLQADETLSEWRWMDGTLVTSFNWYPGRPHNRTDFRCGKLDRTTHLWEDNLCQETHTFLCEVPVCQTG